MKIYLTIRPLKDIKLFLIKAIANKAVMNFQVQHFCFVSPPHPTPASFVLFCFLLSTLKLLLRHKSTAVMTESLITLSIVTKKSHGVALTIYKFT